MNENNEKTSSINELGKKKITVTKASDLILRVESEPEPIILWNGIVEGSKGMIVGLSKTGKTTMAENLAVSIAVGKTEYLGFPISGIPKKVLFVNLEESYKIRTLRNIKQISKLTSSERALFNENYFSTPEDFPEFMNSDEDWDKLRGYIIASEAEVIFIDSLSHMVKGQIETSDVCLKFVQKFRHYISNLNKTTIVIHHNVKGNDKAITQDSIAGSRVVSQEFEYAIGLSNIHTESGGKYLCMLYNKYIETDSAEAILYKINQENWLEKLGEANRFRLYSGVESDNRQNSTNKDLIYNYCQSQISQGSQSISSADLMDTFVKNDAKTMSKDTLYKSIEKLKLEGKLKNAEKGVYQLVTKEDDEK
jgi:RecA-family ATPase